MEHRRWMRYVHGPDKSGSKCGEKICDDACHWGMIKWSKFLHADEQEGDQFKAVQGLAVMEESCWLMQILWRQVRLRSLARQIY